MNFERLAYALLRCEFAQAVQKKNWPRMRMINLRIQSQAKISESKLKLARSRKRLEHRPFGSEL